MFSKLWQEFRFAGAFTLIELLITVGILAVLITAAVPVFTHRMDDARNVADKNNVVVLQRAADHYRIDTTVWPQGANFQQKLIADPMVAGWDGPYLKSEIISPYPGNEPYTIGINGWVISPHEHRWNE